MFLLPSSVLVPTCAGVRSPVGTVLRGGVQPASFLRAAAFLRWKCTEQASNHSRRQLNLRVRFWFQREQELRGWIEQQCQIKKHYCEL